MTETWKRHYFWWPRHTENRTNEWFSWGWKSNTGRYRSLRPAPAFINGELEFWDE